MVAIRSSQSRNRHILDKKRCLLSLLMNRFLIFLVFFALAISGAKAEEVIHSDWAGGCTINGMADISCKMRRDARTTGGRQLGCIVFGWDETSRYLLVEVELPASASEGSLVTTIDDTIVAGGELFCRSNGSCFSATIVLDAALLKRLASGTVLTVRTQRKHEIKIQFPLYGFQRARMILL